MSKRSLGLCIILFLAFLSTLPGYVLAPEPSNISFQPNILDEVAVHFVEEFFRFQWLGNRFDLKLTIGYNDTDGIKELSLRDFWEKTDRVMNWHEVLERADAVVFGYNITGIPSEYADRVLYLLWKIEEASFDVSEIEAETIEDISPALPEGYNLSRFYLPGGLMLSYEDLYEYGFTVSHPSKLVTKIENVQGKQAWNLDPIIFSHGVITITGYSTEATACSHNDIYNAMLNSTFQKTMDQYFSNALIIIGDGTNPTWFVDSACQVEFNSSVLSANYQDLYTVSTNSYLKFGIVIENATRRTRSGVSVICYAPTYHTINFVTGVEIYLYSSFFDGGKYTPYPQKVVTAKTLWNCVLQNAYFGGTNADVFNVDIIQGIYGIRRPTLGTFEQIRAHTQAYGLYFYTGYWVRIVNFYVRNCTYLARIINPNQDSFFINFDSDIWTFNSWSAGSAEVYRQNHFDLAFTLPNGSYAENTNVTISNDYLGSSDSWILSSNGSIPQQTYSYGHYNFTGGNTLYDYNPYNITATLEGYRTHTQLINLTIPESLTIALLEEETGGNAFNSTYYLLGGISFLPISLAMIIIFMRKRQKDAS